MIGKISKGTGFKGCVNYVLGKPDARLLTAEGVLTDSIQTITDCFQTQRMMTEYSSACGTYLTQLCARGYSKINRMRRW